MVFYGISKAIRMLPSSNFSYIHGRYIEGPLTYIYIYILKYMP